MVQCLRRSYFDRIEPLEIERRGFNELLSGLLRKQKYGSEPKEFEIEDIKLKGETDMLVDDIVLIFRSAEKEIENPLANDVLYLNACLWIYDKHDGIIVYVSGDRKETTFSVTRNKKMFEDQQTNVLKLEKTLDITRKQMWKGAKQERGIFYFIVLFALLHYLYYLHVDLLDVIHLQFFLMYRENGLMYFFFPLLLPEENRVANLYSVCFTPFSLDFRKSSNIW